jgi:hypothetical protein
MPKANYSSTSIFHPLDHVEEPARAAAPRVQGTLLHSPQEEVIGEIGK